jgi:hypothetical protein
MTENCDARAYDMMKYGYFPKYMQNNWMQVQVSLPQYTTHSYYNSC